MYTSQRYLRDTDTDTETLLSFRTIYQKALASMAP